MGDQLIGCTGTYACEEGYALENLQDQELGGSRTCEAVEGTSIAEWSGVGVRCSSGSIIMAVYGSTHPVA